MRIGHGFSRWALVLLGGLVALTATGCFGTKGFPADGNMRVRIINESADAVSDITVTHGSQSLYVAQLARGSRTMSNLPIRQDEDITVSYFHPQVGSERESYDFRAREVDAGYVEIRFDRYGALDVRSRFKLTESH